MSVIREIVFAALAALALCVGFTPVGTDSSFVELLVDGIQSKMFLLTVLFVSISLFYVHFDRFVGEGAASSPSPSGNRHSGELVYALLLSAAITVGRAQFSSPQSGWTEAAYGSVTTLYASGDRIAFSLVVFVGLSIFLFRTTVVLFSRFEAILKPVTDEDGDPSRSEKLLPRAADAIRAHPNLLMLLFVICWIPYLVVFFPGAIYADGAAQLAQYFGRDQWSTHHPLLPGLIMGWCVGLGRMLGSDTLGVFFYTCLQMLLIAYACARVTRMVLASPHAKVSWLGLSTVLYFALVPLWGATVISVKKDALYYFSFALLVISSFEFLQAYRSVDADHVRGRRWSHAFKLALFALLTALTRNEGILVVTVMLLCLFLFVCREKRKPGAHMAPSAGSATWSRRTGAEAAIPEKKRFELQPLLALVFTIVVYVIGYRGILIPSLGAANGSIGEALSIPIQQVARCYAVDPDSIPADVDEDIRHLLLVDKITSETYLPYSSDNMKFGAFNFEHTDDDVLVFLRGYAKLGLVHPGLYLSAFLDQTLGWWYPEAVGSMEHTISEMGIVQITPKYEWYEDFLDVRMLFTQDERDMISEYLIHYFSALPGFGLLMYPPVYLWTYLFLFVYVARFRPKRHLLLLIPALLYLLICLAAPASGLTRYILPLAMTLPVYMRAFASRPRAHIPRTTSGLADCGSRPGNPDMTRARGLILENTQPITTISNLGER